MVKEKLNGLEGWLGLFGAIFLLFVIPTNLYLFFSFALENLFIGLIFLGLFAYSIFIFVLYVREKKSFIKHIKIYFISGIVINVLAYILSILTNPEESTFGFSLILGSVVWLIYFYKSKRVKNTFVK